MAMTDLDSIIWQDVGRDDHLQIKKLLRVTHLQILHSVNNLTVDVYDNAIYNHVLVIDGNQTCNITINLRGTNARVNLWGLILSKTRTPKLTTTINHQATSGTSSQDYRFVLADSSNPQIEANLNILANKKFNNASQFCRALLLDNSSRLHAKPWLRIMNNEVACSHGVASGPPNEAELNYLLSRGLTVKMASTMLAHAFIAPIIAQLTTKDLQNQTLLKLSNLM